jgi:hypothetical protein
LGASPNARRVDAGRDRKSEAEERGEKGAEVVAPPDAVDDAVDGPFSGGRSEDKRRGGANAPRAAVSAALGCVRSSTPAIADRLVENPMWAAWQVYDVWIGGKNPEAVVLEIAPSCAGPMNLLKPYLDGAARA